MNASPVSQQRAARCRDGADDLGRTSPARLLGIEWIDDTVSSASTSFKDSDLS